MWVDPLITISVILLLMLLFPLGYLLLLAIGSIRSALTPDIHRRCPSTRFMIIIPAYDETRVIGTTVSRLFAIDYPSQTLSLLGLILLMIQVSINDFIQPIFPLPLIGTWAAVVVAVLIYPRVGRKQVTCIHTEHGNLD
jgi:cellulose synthase/poly-beta-1,6-N-acetylglucosamine synthase-like glycosyltransferase